MNKNENIRFCIQCGTALERRFVSGEERPICPECGWTFYPDPKVAAGVIIEENERVLLVRRTGEPGRGMWSIPAGFVNAYEDPARAAERECLEETGLVVAVTGLQQVIAGREHEHGADFILIYRGRITGGELKAGDDADMAQFFSRDQLPLLAFRATRAALGVE